MALTQTEKEWLDEKIENASITAAERIIEKVMIAHVQSCPHGQKLTRMIFLIAGISAGSGIAGGSLGFGLLRLILSAG